MNSDDSPLTLSELGQKTTIYNRKGPSKSVTFLFDSETHPNKRRKGRFIDGETKDLANEVLIASHNIPTKSLCWDEKALRTFAEDFVDHIEEENTASGFENIQRHSHSTGDCVFLDTRKTVFCSEKQKNRLKMLQSNTFTSRLYDKSSSSELEDAKAIQATYRRAQQLKENALAQEVAKKRKREALIAYLSKPSQIGSPAKPKDAQKTVPFCVHSWLSKYAEKESDHDSEEETVRVTQKDRTLKFLDALLSSTESED